MAKIIVTYNEVIELNHILNEKGLSFKLHLHDGCGSQSFTMEPLGNSACEGRCEEMELEVEKYFTGKGIQIRFLENHLGFVILPS